MLSKQPTSSEQAVPGTPCAVGTRQTAFDANGNETTGANATGRTASYHLTDHTKTFTIGGSPVSMVYLGAGQDRWTQDGSATFQHNVLGLGSRTVSGTTTYSARDDRGTLVSRRTGATKHFYLFDALGSVTGLVVVVALTDTARAVDEPYGGREMSATGAAASADVAGGQFGFAGGYRTTAGGLYHVGQRYYDVSVMRWTQVDPISGATDLRQGNRYVYAAGDPVGIADPYGLWGSGSTAGCYAGPVSVSGSRDDGEDKSGVDTGIGLGAGGGCSGSRSENESGKGVSAGAEVCVVGCVGWNSDSGWEFGVGVEVSAGAGIEINF